MPEPAIKTPAQWQEAYKKGDSLVSSFHATPCWEWRRVTQNLTMADAGKLTREDIGEWKGWLEGLGAEAKQTAALDQLLNPATYVVVSGQQACAGMGPMLVLYKALAARHWADRIERETGNACLAVFWIASDDHDLEEIRHVSWIGAEGELERHDLAADEGQAGRSIHNVAIDAEKAAQLLVSIRETTRETEFRSGVIAALERSMGAGATFESHFARLAIEWLLPLGIIPVVPRLGFLRRHAAPLIRREVIADLETNRLVAATSERIQRIGVKPPIHRTGNELNFFVEVDGIRCKVVRERDDFIASRPGGGEMDRFTRDGLLELIAGEPGIFSPNAILRPLVQDLVLPTVVYIAGPTELVYHAQIGDLYTHFDVPRPAVFPRPNVVLLEGRTEKAARKLGLDPSRLGKVEELDEAVGRALQSSDIVKEVRARLDQIEAGGEALEQFMALHGRDSAIEKALRILRENLQKNGEKLAERVEQFALNLDSDKARSREKLAEFLFPAGEPQERIMGILAPVLVNHGPDVIQRLYNDIQFEAAGFQAVSLNPEK